MESELTSGRGRVLLDSCRIDEIGLDGAVGELPFSHPLTGFQVASVGGQLDVIDSFICSCGESGIVASGPCCRDLRRPEVTGGRRGVDLRARESKGRAIDGTSNRLQHPALQGGGSVGV